MKTSILISIQVFFLFIDHCSSSPYFFLNHHHAAPENNFTEIYDGSCSSWTVIPPSKLVAGYPKMCSLETPSIIVPKGIDEAKSILSLFKISVGKCTLVDGKCREQLEFDVVITFKDNKEKFIQRALMPNWTVTESRDFKTDSTKQIIRTINLPKNQRKITSIKLTINSKNFIGSILQVSLWTNACLQTIASHAVFPYSVTPGYTNGTCVENAVSLLPYLKGDCTSTGYQSFLGICLCGTGYMSSGDQCIACPSNYFKTSFGYGNCTKCGMNSYRLENSTSQNCQCKEGFVRYSNETSEFSKPCHDRNKIDCPKDSFKINSTIDACLKCGANSFRISTDYPQNCRCRPGFIRYKNETKMYEKACHDLKVFGKCANEKIVMAVDEVYHFISIDINEKLNFSCIYGQTDEAKKLNKTTVLFRRCLFSDLSYSAEWQPLDLSTCRRNTKGKTLENVDVNDIDNKTVNEFSKQISNLTSNTSLVNNEQAVQNLTKVLEKIVDIQNTSIEVKENVLKILDNIIPINESIIPNENKNQLLSFVDKITENIQQPSFNYSGQNLAVSIQTRNRSQATNIKSFEDNDQIKIQFGNSPKNAEISINTTASIYLPQSTYENSQNDLQIISTAYKKDTFFSNAIEEEKTGEDWEVGSFIMSASVKGQVVEGLTTPVNMTFKVNGTKYDLPKAKCVFWDIDGNYWSTRGCKTLVNSKNEVTCECNHLTNFAILFNVYQVDEDVLKSQELLNYVSLIGCILSTGCLAATLFAFSCARHKHTRRKTAQLIIINFCIALTLLLIAFMLTTKITITSGVLCHTMSGVLHFLLLATFSWTATQASFLYKKTVRATRNFKGEDRRTFYISFCLAWGLPIVVSGVTSNFTSAQFVEPVTHSCIMKGDIFIYSTIIPIACIILFNLIVFIMVMRKVHGHFKTRASFQQNEDKQMWKRAKATMACMVLLGLTWSFGFMAVGDLRAPLQWLFCITNTLQGVFVFVFYVLLNDEVRKAWNSNWTESSFTSTLVSRATNIRKLVAENGLTLVSFATKSPSPKPKHKTTTET
ncbi:adhesion G protein-coupled receptor L4-like [Clytia hemisphaerica]